MKDILITSSVLILVLLILRRLFRNSISRRVQYALWGLVLVRLLVPFSLPSPLSVLNATRPAEEAVSDRLTATPVYLHPMEQYPASLYPNTPDATVDTATIIWDHQRNQPDGYLALDPGGETVTKYAIRTYDGEILLYFMSIIWKAGMALVGSFFLLSNLLFYVKLRKNRTEWTPTVSRKVYLVPEGLLPSPCLFWNAIYLTPAALRSEESIRHVLCHEETHAKHWDPLWSLLRCVCLTVYWFDPLVWAAAACARTDCELACDEAVLEKLGEAERIPYGQTLLSLIPVKRSNPLLTATTMTAGKRQLKDRIIRIAQKPRQLLAAVAAVAILLLAVSACTFTGGEPVPYVSPSPSPVESPEPSPSPTPAESLESSPTPTPVESQEPFHFSSDTIYAPGVPPFSWNNEGTRVRFGIMVSPSSPTPETGNGTTEQQYFLALCDGSVPTRTHHFDLAGIPGDNTYRFFANSFGETVFEWKAGTTVSLLTLHVPESANLRIRLETEDGAAAAEYTLKSAESSVPEILMLHSPEAAIPAAGRYQVKVAAGEELNQGELILRVMSPVPDLEWPEDFPIEMYNNIQVIESDSYYAYLGTVKGLPRGGTDYYISVIYKDGRPQWQYIDKDNHSPDDPLYSQINFGDEPHQLIAYGMGENQLILDVEAQELVWQGELPETTES
ncbi:MAG: M56 family metallopeptidase [Oscillospiraceae bacterium]|nr:M56 family metallopeptidase [Oscillospiraceae bacterium]